MFLYACNALAQPIPNGVTLSSLMEDDKARYGISDYGALFLLDGAGGRRIKLRHACSKMTLDPENDVYFCFGGSSLYPNMFMVDRSFREVDCLRLGRRQGDAPILDIWFDPCQRVLLVLTETQIDRHNANGDYLGAFMTAPRARSYKAICTFGAFLFVAYEEGGCLFVASYAQNGTFIEKLGLGNEYSVCNMQVLASGDHWVLNLFVYKHGCFPYVIQIMLEGNVPPDECGDIVVECCGQDGLCVSCNVEKEGTV